MSGRYLNLTYMTPEFLSQSILVMRHLICECKEAGMPLIMGGFCYI